MTKAALSIRRKDGFIVAGNNTHGLNHSVLSRFANILLLELKIKGKAEADDDERVPISSPMIGNPVFDDVVHFLLANTREGGEVCLLIATEDSE